MSWEIREGDALASLKAMPSDSVDCVVTSPPYWGLRDYGVDGQMGLEPTPDDFLAAIVGVFREVRRVLKPRGICWVNIGDSYCTRPNGSIGATTLEGSKAPHAQVRHANALRSFRRDKAEAGGDKHRAVPGLKHKDMVGIPWRLALAMQAGFSTCSGCNLERRSDLWPVHNGHRVCIDCLLAWRFDAKVVQTEKGWWLRSDVIWHKPNPMPESAKDRPTKAHEYLFMFAKSERYHYDHEAIMEPASGTAHPRSAAASTFPAQAERDENRRRPGVNPKAQKSPSGWDREKGSHGTIHRTGRVVRPKQNASFAAAIHKLVEHRNKRTVWTIPTQAFPEAHFATFPLALAEPCILAGCPPGGMVLDPFVGSGTSGCVALLHSRDFIGLELSPGYAAMARRRISDYDPMSGPLFQELA